ncbi:MAG: hypothetical protein MUQ27_15665, partial [Acidimicrobiia bacterium]|nr:hypothetical protein [Acidimicrobiia bacterium]
MRDWVTLFHVLSVIVWFGGSIYLEALMASARRDGDEGALVAAFRTIGATNRRLFNFAGIATV